MRNKDIAVEVIKFINLHPGYLTLLMLLILLGMIAIFIHTKRAQHRNIRKKLKALLEVHRVGNTEIQMRCETILITAGCIERDLDKILEPPLDRSSGEYDLDVNQCAWRILFRGKKDSFAAGFDFSELDQGRVKVSFYGVVEVGDIG